VLSGWLLVQSADAIADSPWGWLFTVFTSGDDNRAWITATEPHPFTVALAGWVLILGTPVVLWCMAELPRQLQPGQ
jgi:hypothetical protein